MTHRGICPFARAVDAHFALALSPGETHELFLHLPSCASCLARHERLLLLESLDPAGVGPQARLRAGLPLPSPARGWRRMTKAASVLALAAGVTLAVTSLRGTPGAFHARGGGEEVGSPRLEVYRMASGATPPRVVDFVGRRDELAFAYANPTGKERLLIFAVDEKRHVYWYYPAWTQADDTPTAVSIQRSASLVELSDAVRHELDGSRIMLYGVFCDDALTVREVETQVARVPPLSARLGLQGTTEISRALEVR